MMHVVKLVAIVVVEDMIFPSVIHYPMFWILNLLKLHWLWWRYGLNKHKLKLCTIQICVNLSFQLCSLDLQTSPSLYPRMKNLPSLYVFSSNLTHKRVTHDMYFLFISIKLFDVASIFLLQNVWWFPIELQCSNINIASYNQTIIWYANLEHHE